MQVHSHVDFFPPINTLENLLEICNDLKKLAEELHSLEMPNNFKTKLGITVRTPYIIHVRYKICVNRPLMLSVRFPIKSRLLVGKFGGHQKL